MSASEPSLARARKKKGPCLARRAAFLERQLSHGSVQARRDLSELHKQLIKDGKTSDDVEFYGSKGVKGFQQFLERRFGSIVAGWRALDRGKTGRLSFYEFCNACRAMGYHGNLKHLWDKLDKNKSGGVSLMEVHPEVGHYVGTFKLACMQKWGDMLTAWRKGIDTNNNGRIDEAELTQVVEQLGLELDGKRLYKMLISGPRGNGMTLADFDPDAWNRWITGDFKGLTMGPNREFLEDLGEDVQLPEEVASHPVRGGALQWRSELNEVGRGIAADERAKVEKMKVGLHTIEGFKQALVARYGSLLSAWRGALDLDGNNRITRSEFFLAMHKLGFHGDVLGLWKKLDSRADGCILFRDMDPETDAGLSEMQEKFEKKYGNMLLAWLKALDVKGTGIVNEQGFARACKSVGFSRDPKKMFRVLQPDWSRKFITLSDFDTRAYLALTRGDFRMLSEQPDTTSKTALEKTFMERQETGWFFNIRKAWEIARREEFAKACKTDDVPEFVIDTVMEFEDLCIRRFGSMMGAWRQALDWDSNGRITFNEFCGSLRRLGYAGNFRWLWRQYDKDGNGQISLKELDPEMDKMAGALLEKLTERYGTIDDAWRVGFGKDPHDSCDFKELKACCDALGYPYDVQKLFKALQPMPGRALLTVWDLDPACNRKRQRGDVRAISMPKSPNWQSYASKPKFGEIEATAALVSSEDNGESTVKLDGSSGEQSSPSGAAPAPRSAADQQTLRICLRNKYGSTVAAWRGTLDPDMRGSVSFGKLVVVLEECAFAGNVKVLWEELSGGRPGVPFKDIDPDAARLLDRLREQLLARSGGEAPGRGSLLRAWEQLDPDGLCRLDEDAFLQGLTRFGIVLKTPKKAFQLLKNRIGQRSLTVEDLQALLIGVPSEERQRVWAGRGEAEWSGPPRSEEQDAEQDAAELAGTSTLRQRSSPLQRSTTSSTPWQAEEPLSPKQKVAQVSQEHHGQDFKVVTLDGFKRILKNKYGSLFAAWRHCLDADQNGVVTQKDFAHACRKLGITNAQQLWSAFDANKDGQISLKEMHPETAELFEQLEKLLSDQFGGAREGWRRALLRTGSSWCELEMFVEGCKALGFQGDASRLFDLVKPEAGRRYLTYEDLWLNLDPNYNATPIDWWMRPAPSPKAGAGAASPSSPLQRSRTRERLKRSLTADLGSETGARS